MSDDLKPFLPEEQPDWIMNAKPPAATEASNSVLPNQPTIAMLVAAEQFHRTEYVYDEFKPLKLYAGIYHAMRAAAPRIQPAASEANGQIEHLDVENHRLRRGMQKLMARLTDLLDEDQFADCEDIVRQAGVEPASEAGPVPVARGDIENIARTLEHDGDPAGIAYTMRKWLDAAPPSAPAAQPEKQAAQDESLTRQEYGDRRYEEGFAAGWGHCVACERSEPPMGTTPLDDALAAPAAENAERVAMRPETISEHISRDIREGRFPQRSEPQMVPTATTADAQQCVGCEGKPSGDNVPCAVCGATADAQGDELIEKIISENPYTNYSYVAQNAKVEKSRAEKHARTLMREALSRQPTQQDAQGDERAIVLQALSAAKRFIRNGVEFGYIRMPDSDCPDPAHQTPILIDRAIAALSRQPSAAAMREALFWYAKQVEDCRKITVGGDAARQRLDEDGGKRARAALAVAKKGDE